MLANTSATELAKFSMRRAQHLVDFCRRIDSVVIVLVVVMLVAAIMMESQFHTAPSQAKIAAKIIMAMTISFQLALIACLSA